MEKENQAFLDERENDLMLALHQLPKKYRQVLILKFFNELSSKQIANKLHVTQGHVDNISAKAYIKLRKILKTKYRF
jgi:RNA polymerase sigma-70 factor (ECF subfamily)